MTKNIFQSFKIEFLVLLILGIGSSAIAQQVKIPEQAKLTRYQVGYHRMKIGKIDVTAVSDGTGGVNFLELLTNAKPGEVEDLFAREYINPKAVQASMNAYLIEIDNKFILVDTGAGELFGPHLNKITDSLRSSGVQPEQITDILITHIHPDHSGGLTVAGKRVFPNATVHVNKRELDYWTDKSLGAKAPEPTKSFFLHRRDSYPLRQSWTLKNI